MQDGYGNELTDQEMVENYWKWAHKVAGSILPRGQRSHDFDDVVQEGLIHVLKTADGMPAPFVAKGARYRMLAAATGERQPTGGDPTPGPRYRPTTVSHDADESGEWLDSLMRGPDLLDAAALAYHHGELAQVINGLEPRDRNYIVQRFWNGKTDTEIAAEDGVARNFWHTRWRKTLAPRLAKELAHLA
jgi:DNA-directed RNA polymerase specialized sigma24 family protein